MQDLPHHLLPADRHAELVDRLCELPDGPDRRECIIKLLTELGGISAAPVAESTHEDHDQPREDSLTETEELILHLLDDLEDVSDLGRR